MIAGLVFLLAGCPKAPPTNLDLELPDGKTTVDARAPLVILTEQAGNDNPGPRAHALAYLITASSEPGGGDWAERALWDPDGWVQRAGALALVHRNDPLSRERLTAWMGRTTADPYARGAAAVRLPDPSPELRAQIDSALAAENARWRQAPLALAAILLGDPEAKPSLQAALARGDIALEPLFLDDLARVDPSIVQDSLEEGADWVEDELALAYAASRLRAGDNGGEQVLRRALDADLIGTRLEAVEQLARVPTSSGRNLLDKARSSRDDLVSAHATAALGALPDASLGQLVALATHPDPEVRATVRRRAAERMKAETTLPKKDRKLLVGIITTGLSDGHAAVRTASLVALRTAHLEPELARPLLGDGGAINRLHAAGVLHIK